MAVATNDSYSSENPIRIGLTAAADTPLGIAAAALSGGFDSALLSTNNLNTLVDGHYVNEGVTNANDPVQDWCTDVPYHPTYGPAGTGAPNGSNIPDAVVLGYDYFSNTWWNDRDPFNGVNLTHFYSKNMINRNTDELICIPRATSSQGVSYGYNLADNTTRTNPMSNPPTSLGSWDSGNWNAVHAIAFHPNYGTAGSCIHVNANANGGLINRYDFDTATWSNLAPQGLNMSAGRYTAHTNYFADVVVVGGGDATRGCWLVSNTGVVTSVDALPYVAFQDTNFLPHPSEAKSSIFGDDGNIYTLDYGTGTWSSQSATGELAAIMSNPNVYPFTADNLGVMVFQAYISGGNSKVVVVKP